MTPRPYLSWSQMSLLERSPDQYRKVYVNGETGYSNRAMNFGSEIGKHLEDDSDSGEADRDFVLSQMPRLEIPEHEVYATLGKGKHAVPLIAKLDSVKADLSKVLEYKTGKTKWTKSKVDRNGQLTFYATVVYLKTGKIPELELVWAETEHAEGSAVTFTGKVHSFKTQRHMGEIIQMMQRMRDAWAQIKNMTEAALV